MKALIHQKNTLFQVSLKVLKPPKYCLSKLRTNPKLLDLRKLILMRSKSLLKYQIANPKRLLKNLIWAQIFLNKCSFFRQLHLRLCQCFKFHNGLKEADMFRTCA